VSYTPSTDFLALLRQTPAGARLAQVPGLDFVVSALARAGLINLWINPTAGPTSGQQTTAWLKVSSSSWATEGTLFLWDRQTEQYQPANPSNFADFIMNVAAAPGEVDLAVSTALTSAQMDDTLYTNANGGALQVILPPPAPGLRAQFAVVVAEAFTIKADEPTSVIRWGASSSASLGELSSSAIGSFIRIRAVNGNWYVTNGEGQWALQ
jgi:hypothetical protein